MNDLFQIAASQLGVKEISGNEDNPIIVKYAQESGFTSITDDETPWCSIFVNWCSMKAGLQRTHKANARSWLWVGMPVSAPIPGDVVIFWRESLDSWKGHVGFFVGYAKDGKTVFVLGGNQRNCVSIQQYDAGKILGFRRLTSEGNAKVPQAPLSIGSRGDEVKALQQFLNENGFQCGAVDGIFGKNTSKQLSYFQLKHGVKQTGVYDSSMQTIIENIYQS